MKIIPQQKFDTVNNSHYSYDNMTKIFQNSSSKISVVLFTILTAWWIFIHTAAKGNENALLGFAATYGAMALFGGIVGLIASKRWGGAKSVVGRALLIISLGLFAQEFGQLTYAYITNIQHVEIPYPSVGDVGYFGSVLLYIYGIYLIAKTVGARISLKTAGNKLQAVVIPVVLLAMSYFLFLKGYEFDWSHPLTVILDFGYPLGQAVYISIALLAFSLSRKYLGGIMKNRILVLLAAFFFQYVADFNFLYQNSHETWVNGGYGDYLYLVSYFVMGVALIYFTSALGALHSGNSNDTKEEAA